MTESQDNGEAPAKDKSGRGQFFAVDWRCAEEASKLGINAALAYVALARFTGRSHQSTIAGMTALHNRLGLSRGRAALALTQLENVGLITPPTKGTARKLTTWGGLEL